VTTDYVLDETATLLKARGHVHLVPVLLKIVFSSAACTVCWTDAERFQATCEFFVVMKDQRLRDSLTKDAHFREAGFQPLLA